VRTSSLARAHRGGFVNDGLRATQRWFAAVVTGESPLPARTRRVATRGRLEGRERLAIHRFAYSERLRGVLANDFPAVQSTLGDRQFARLAAAYVREHPSRHPNLNQLGAGFVSFSARRLTRGPREFVVDLLRFEAAIARAHEAPFPPPLDVESLRAIDPVRWPRLRLRLQPSACLLTSRTNVAAWYDAWTNDAAPARARPGRSWSCVHRSGSRVVRHVLDRAQFEVLWAIESGATLGAALRNAGDAISVGAWFREMAGSGLFVAPPRER